MNVIEELEAKLAKMKEAESLVKALVVFLAEYDKQKPGMAREDTAKVFLSMAIGFSVFCPKDEQAIMVRGLRDMADRLESGEAEAMAKSLFPQGFKP